MQQGFDVVLGRGTFDYRAEYWATSDVQPFADLIKGTPKHVFTSSQPTVSWSQSTIVTGSPVPYVQRLAADLIDRFELVIVPILAGSGRHLFADQLDLRRLTLTEATRPGTGCVFLGYRRTRRGASTDGG